FDLDEAVADVPYRGNESQPLSYEVLERLEKQVLAVVEGSSDRGFTGWDPLFTREECVCSMVMKGAQAISERMMERTVESILDKFGLDPAETYLSVTGGFALNCPCNSMLMKKYGFRGFLSYPAADARLAAGSGRLMSFWN
ncbi:MAG: hypothetical protein ACLQVD_20535, partial [Capsulimonadaceae bacterium]